MTWVLGLLLARLTVRIGNKKQEGNERVNSFETLFLEKRTPPVSPAYIGLPKNLFPQDSFPCAQLPRHLVANVGLVEVGQTATQASVDLGIIHVMLVLQAHRMQELWSHGGFHPDVKGRPGKPGNV
jgi:hypothetical protein